MKSHKIIEHTAGSKKLHRKNLRGGFTQRVLHVVSLIPLGKTMTYAQVAEHAGNPKAFRAVGNILNKNRDPFIPCHRVIR